MRQKEQTVTPRLTDKSCLSRFTIVLLGAVLLGMGAGRQLGNEHAELCTLLGLMGVACYLSLELVAIDRDRQRAWAIQHSAENRLAAQRQWHRFLRYWQASKTSTLREVAPEPNSPMKPHMLSAATLRAGTFEELLDTH